ncbi:MAG: adenylosuccinate lyase [Bacteriovoracaceae bacterium]
MIPRYEVKDISELWTDEKRYETLLKVELALLNALEQKQKIPQGTANAFAHVKINPARIQEIESLTQHDLIAFCTSITEQVKTEEARYFHFGVTSSDILDTALTLQLRESLQVIIKDIENLLCVLQEQVEKTKHLLTMGRSHGMFAEPMVFAQKFLSFHQEIFRRLNDYQTIIKQELTGQISGAVGNYTILDTEIEQLTLDQLSLKVEKVSTQVIPRDHLAKIISNGALLASALERMAVELRLLHHSDVSELHEGFKPGQKGSSTMPHKKNPISAENITGISRLIRSHLEVALQNNVLWHERDISHSSTERMYLPDHFGLISYALRRMSSTLERLELHSERIEAKVQENFASLSSYFLHQLILLNPTSREELYAFIQEASFCAKTREEFFTWIETTGSKRGYKLPKLLTPTELKHHYLIRFEAVLERTIN